MLPLRLIADRFISIRSNDPGATDTEQVTFPLSCQFMHTMHYKIHTGRDFNPPSDLTKQFGAITWELLNILKENFPSKVQLEHENIEKCAPFYMLLSTSELTRRMLSCILSMREEARALTTDEVEDVTWVMDYAARLKEYRSLSACLDLLQGTRVSDADFLHCLRPYRDTLLHILESEDPRQLQSNQRIVHAILQKFDLAEEDR